MALTLTISPKKHLNKISSHSSVYVTTKEEAGKITYKLMLFFKDREDYLSSHEMFAKIVDGNIIEYNL